MIGVLYVILNMPNCDWYGTKDDHAQILDFLFDSNTCEVYELSSDFDKPLKLFTSTQAVLDQFKRKYSNGKLWNSVYLQIMVLGCGPNFQPTRVVLDPLKCSGATHKYKASGWGLIQLYLHTISDGALGDSHSNHNSLKRAESWSLLSEGWDSPEDWNFSGISKFSSRLNRTIRKAAVAKIESRVILPNAYEHWKEGGKLNPYDPKLHASQLRLI